MFQKIRDRIASMIISNFKKSCVDESEQENEKSD